MSDSTVIIAISRITPAMVEDIVMEDVWFRESQVHLAVSLETSCE